MHKLKVLITTIGGLTSADLIHALHHNGEKEFELYGTDSFSFPTARYMVRSFFLSPDSAKEEDAFVDFILDLCAKHHFDLIIPCGNEDNLALAKHKHLFTTPILVGEYADLIKAYDKGVVYETLANLLPSACPKFQIVRCYDEFQSAMRSLSFPENKVVIKPRFGRGGRGVYVISSKIDFERFFDQKPQNEVSFELIDGILKQQETFEDLILMEYLKPPFLSAYSLCRQGHNLITLEHVREWGNASQTYRGLVSYHPKLESICSEIIKIFNLDYTNNMELAFNAHNQITLFDLNPRLGASSGIDSEIGLNFPYLAIKLLLNEPVEIDKSQFTQKRRFMRYFSYQWLPEEDKAIHEKTDSLRSRQHPL